MGAVINRSARIFQPYHTGIEITSKFNISCAAIFFQPYHTGIEIGIRFSGYRHPLPFNRTILELKSKISSPERKMPATFNRTILELKWCKQRLSGSYLRFQPYHTGIEISIRISNICPRKTFNRTILELKSHNIILKSYKNETFNRTILELKLIEKYHTSGVEGLSTVPYWNWNECSSETCNIERSFQPYHTGIEILKK